MTTVPDLPPTLAEVTVTSYAIKTEPVRLFYCLALFSSVLQ